HQQPHYSRQSIFPCHLISHLSSLEAGIVGELHFARSRQLLNNLLYPFAGDGKSKSNRPSPSTTSITKSIYANYIAFTIYQRSTRVTLINGCIGLQLIYINMMIFVYMILII